MALHEWENVVDSIKDKPLFSLDLSIILGKKKSFSQLSLTQGFRILIHSGLQYFVNS